MLKKNDIILRAMEPEDVEVLYKWENDKELWHLSSTTKPFSRYQLEQYVLNAHLDIYELKQMRLMISVKADKEVCTIGCIDLYDFDAVNKRAGVGILIAENWRQKGVATLALHALIDHVRQFLDLHQLYCSIIEDNISSQKVFEKTGFKKTGKRLCWTRKGQEWKNDFFYQLIFNS